MTADATEQQPAVLAAAPRQPGDPTPPHAITIEIDRHKLRSYTDEFLTTAWHVAQANPAPFGDHDAGELVQHLGWEIIRRWLGQQNAPLHHHQPQHYYWEWLRKFATYKPGGPSGTPDWHHGVWVPKPPAANGERATGEDE